MLNLGVNLLKKDNSNTIVDYALEGGFDSQGKLKKLWGYEALSNAIKVWLESEEGEFYGFPTRSGSVVKWLNKPMSDDTKNSIEASIRNGLTNDFNIRLIIETLIVKANLKNRQWEILLQVTAPDLLMSTTVETQLQVI